MIVYYIQKRADKRKVNIRKNEALFSVELNPLKAMIKLDEKIRRMLIYKTQLQFK